MTVLSLIKLVIIILAVTLIALAMIFNFSDKKLKAKETIRLGVSFSPTYAEDLDLDWKKTYKQILTNLKVKYLRIPTYWRDLEPKPNEFRFDSVDFMLEEAQKSKAKVLLVVGIKQPRWPECQPPNWAYRLSLQDRQEKTLQIIQKVIERYKDREEIWGWQVENEPLFHFGARCDPPNVTFLQREVEFAKHLDPTRPVVLTDTGEWSLWIDTMKFSDVLGISLYRKTHNQYFGYVKIPFPKSYYTLKSDLLRKYLAPKNQKTIVAELQTEPWALTPLSKTPFDEQIMRFSPQEFQDNVQFAKDAGFDEIYLWGVEWWFYMAKQGYPEYLEIAKKLFSQ